VEFNAWMVPRPFVDYGGEGDGCRYLAFGLRTARGADPIVCVEIDLRQP
jgi:hypothetical protein